MRRLTFIGISCLLLATVQNTAAQRGSFMDHLRFGFGGGANAAQIIDLEAYNIYEDLSGAETINTYSGLFQSIGNQYFIQMEWFNEYFIVNLKPGTYSYHFSKTNGLQVGEELIEQENPYLLRYIGIPLEARYNLDLKRFRPYLGLSLAYSHLLGSHDAANQSFIRPKFTAGAVAGTYMDLGYVILDLNLGYMAGLHNIVSKADRFGTGSGLSFAQNDMLLSNLQLSLSILFSLQKQKVRSAVECYY